MKAILNFFTQGIWIIAFGVLIDALQALVAWMCFALGSALQAITPVGGAIGGAAAGCYINAAHIADAAGCAKGAIVGALAGAGASAFGIPLGIVLGMALSLCISLTVGAGFIVLLSMTGYFYPKYFFGAVVEIIPGLDYVPGWTLMAVLCVMEKTRKQGGVLGAVAGVTLAAANPSVSSVSGAVSGMRTAANDNRPRRVGAEVMAAAVVLLLAFGGGHAAYAQSAVPPPIQYVVTPETPGPKTSTTIEVQGIGSFLGNADITWSQDGKVVARGVGLRSYTFTTGGLGQKTTIRVSVDSSQGLFNSTFTFNPSKINLLWEADTSVPQLYLGRALYSAGSTYRVVAYPTVYQGGARVAQSALTYQWSYKDDAVPEASGLGRSVFTHTGDQLQAGEQIQLDVYYGTAKVGTAALTIPAVNPKIILYPRDPLRGEILESALPAGIALTASELTVQAEPYYFANSALRSNQAPFAWSINDTTATGPDSSRGILTLRQAGAGQGQAQLSVSVQNTNPDQFVQTATAGLQLVFGAQTGNSLLNFLGL